MGWSNLGFDDVTWNTSLSWRGKMKPSKKFKKWFRRYGYHKFEGYCTQAYRAYLKGKKDNRCKNSSKCIDYRTSFKTREV